MTRLLLIEDDAPLARVLRRDLTGAGFTVTLAGSGSEALAACAEREPEVVVLDWGLPDVDGLSLLQHLRDGLLAPVLMLTARSRREDRVAGLQGGADDYLVKPFVTAELVARLRALLRLVSRTRARISQDVASERGALTCGGLRLDPLARRVTRREQELSLTPLEFELLSLFVRHPGRAFARDYLIERVWSEHEGPGSRAVDNAVSRLRAKLAEDGERLQSVWGVGYRWNGAS
jgi:DNA-binding response OmpR family regulator